MPGKSPCPSCGNLLTIDRQTTLTVVCAGCNSVLRRRGDELIPVGSMNAVVSTQSPFSNGQQGTYHRESFQLTGHVILENDSGASWEEWYLGFSDGQCGWLSYTQGRLLLLFPTDVPRGVELPSLHDLRLNQPLDLMPGLNEVHVVEKGEAHVKAASGQIPYLMMPGDSFPYADFAASTGAFASLDYSETPPSLFVGREVTFEDLGLDRAQPQADVHEGPVVAPTGTIHCTECATAMEVRTPGRTERVTCPQCRTVFDIRSGHPKMLDQQAEQLITPALPVGTVGRLTEGDFTVIGIIQKATTDDLGVTYYWEEYLLSDGRGGYRWIVQSDKHWTLFESVTCGSDIQPVVTLGGKSFKFFQHGEARVTYLEGEFFWNVRIGESTYTSDFVAPPQMLSVEYCQEGSTKGEANWTLGTYMPTADVERAFGVSGLACPSSVGPNQPFGGYGIYKIWALCSLLVIVAGVAMMFLIRPTVVLDNWKIDVKEEDFKLKPGEVLQPGEEKVVVHVTDIELKGRRNIKIMARGNLRNSWIHVVGYIIDGETLVMQPFEIPIEHWSGTHEGEAFNEDNTSNAIHLSSLPAGNYKLKIGIFAEDPSKRTGRGPGGEQFDASRVESVVLRMEQGHPRWWHLFVALGILAVIPLIVWLVQLSFESRRWQNSNVSPPG